MIKQFFKYLLSKSMKKTYSIAFALLLLCLTVASASAFTMMAGGIIVGGQNMVFGVEKDFSQPWNILGTGITSDDLIRGVVIPEEPTEEPQVFEPGLDFYQNRYELFNQVYIALNIYFNKYVTALETDDFSVVCKNEIPLKEIVSKSKELRLLTKLLVDKISAIEPTRPAEAHIQSILLEKAKALDLKVKKLAFDSEFILQKYPENFCEQGNNNQNNNNEKSDADKLTDFENEYDAFDEQYDDFKDDLETAEDDNDEDEIDDIKDDLQDLYDDVDKLYDELTQFKGVVPKNLKDDVSDLKEDVKALKAKIKCLIDEDSSSCDDGNNNSNLSDNSYEYTPTITTTTNNKQTTTVKKVEEVDLITTSVQPTQASTSGTNTAEDNNDIVKFTESSTYFAILISGFILLLGIAVFLGAVAVRLY